MNIPNSIEINGERYIKADNIVLAPLLESLPYVIVRTNTAGVFAGYLKKRSGLEGILLHSRRLWHWQGAASLSQLAVDGVSCPNDCKFPCEIEGEHILTQIIEIIPCTKKSQDSIASVPVWKF